MRFLINVAHFNALVGLEIMWVQEQRSSPLPNVQDKLDKLQVLNYNILSYVIESFVRIHGASSDDFIAIILIVFPIVIISLAILNL